MAFLDVPSIDDIENWYMLFRAVVKACEILKIEKVTQTNAMQMKDVNIIEIVIANNCW